MKQQGQTPAEKDSQKAAEEMSRAIDKTVKAEKSNRRFGTDEGKKDAAENLKEAAEKDTGKQAN